MSPISAISFLHCKSNAKPLQVIDGINHICHKQIPPQTQVQNDNFLPQPKLVDQGDPDK